MSERTLKRLLGALGAAAALWLVIFFVSNRAADSEPEIESAIATFFDGASDTTLSAVRLSSQAGAVELRRVAGSWMVNGFRSDSGSIARFFQTLGNSRVASLAASNPTNHARMGVAADTAARVELEGQGASRTLLIGVDGPRSATVYARLPDEDAVYLLDSGIRSFVFRQLDDWRNRRMVRIDTAQVRRIAVTRDRDSFELVRGDSAWTFANGTPADANQVRGLMNELAQGVVASRFVADTDSIGMLPQAGRTVVYDATGQELTAVTVGGGTGDRWGMVAGDSVRYRLPPFRVDLVVPTLESVRP